MSFEMRRQDKRPAGVRLSEQRSTGRGTIPAGEAYLVSAPLNGWAYVVRKRADGAVTVVRVCSVTAEPLGEGAIFMARGGVSILAAWGLGASSPEGDVGQSWASEVTGWSVEIDAQGAWLRPPQGGGL